MSVSAFEQQNGGAPANPRRAYIHRHTVSFEETNVVGNVYYARHVSWQGRCREMFLRERVPQILDDLAADFRLVTLKVWCEYYQELRAFDELEIAMSLTFQHAHRVGLSFDYFVIGRRDQPLAARGFQEIACMRAGARGLAPAALPAALAEALQEYRAAPPVRRRPLPPDLARPDNDCPKQK